MTSTQRYLFDLYGFLHLQNVLSPEELAAAQEAAARYIATAPEDLPPGFEIDGRRFTHGFAFDKALEKLVFHPGIWPIVLELTNYKPQLLSGTLQIDDVDIYNEGLHLHCAREDYGWESTRYEARDGRIYCDDFAVFPYLDDVFPGDGGLLVVPGSHKSNFPRPAELFDHGNIEEGLPDGIVNVTPRAGDVVILPELATHGALPWKPVDRQRRALVLRYRPHHRGGGSLPDEIVARLWPETQELIAPAHYTHTKAIAKMDEVVV